MLKLWRPASVQRPSRLLHLQRVSMGSPSLFNCRQVTGGQQLTGPVSELRVARLGYSQEPSRPTFAELQAPVESHPPQASPPGSFQAVRSFGADQWSEDRRRDPTSNPGTLDGTLSDASTFGCWHGTGRAAEPRTVGRTAAAHSSTRYGSMSMASPSASAVSIAANEACSSKFR